MTTPKELTVQNVLDAWAAWEEMQADPYTREVRAAIEHLDRAYEHLKRELATVKATAEASS